MLQSEILRDHSFSRSDYYTIDTCVLQWGYWIVLVLRFQIVQYSLSVRLPVCCLLKNCCGPLIRTFYGNIHFTWCMEGSDSVVFLVNTNISSSATVSILMYAL